MLHVLDAQGRRRPRMRVREVYQLALMEEFERPTSCVCLKNLGITIGDKFM